MKMKKTSQVLLLGIVLLLISTACTAISQLPIPSREDIEAKFDRIGEVYPTKNFEDLYDKFPNGFKLERVQYEEKEDSKGNLFYVYIIEVNGDSRNRTFSGNMTVELRNRQDRETISTEVYLVKEIKNNRIIIDGSPEIVEKVENIEFIFLNTAIIMGEFSKLPLFSKFVNPTGTEYNLRYFYDNDWIDSLRDRLNKEGEMIIKIEGDSSYDSKNLYFSQVNLYVKDQGTIALERITEK